MTIGRCVLLFWFGPRFVFFGGCFFFPAFVSVSVNFCIFFVDGGFLFGKALSHLVSWGNLGEQNTMQRTRTQGGF